MIKIKKTKNMKKVLSDSTVTVNYTGRLEDGTIFDSSTVEGREPMTTKLGQGQLIKGFEEGLVDMSEGDKKTDEIESTEAYGEYLDYLIQEVEKSQMPGEVEVGMPLQAQTEMGVVQFVVKEVKDETVVLDANHPLAGKKLIFDLEVVSID
jgi:FKBP-type peptidyl-prolyl cis-trans isomerase SlpA